MNATQRRDKIIDMLSSSKDPVSATTLAKEFLVSRQVIVGDIALIRAFGVNIFATPRGYLLKNNEENNDRIIKTIACKHGVDKLKDELYLIIDNGGAIMDVIVEHPIYGDLTGPLHIFSRFDADEFIKKVMEHNVQPLSALTEGIHLHSISCINEESYDRIIEELKKHNVLL